MIPTQLVNDKLDVSVIAQNVKSPLAKACRWEPHDRDRGIVQIIIENLTKVGKYTVALNKIGLGFLLPNELPSNVYNAWLVSSIDTSPEWLVVQPGEVSIVHSLVKESNKEGIVNLPWRSRVGITILLRDEFKNAIPATRGLEKKLNVRFDDVNITHKNEVTEKLQCWIYIPSRGKYKFQVRQSIKVKLGY